MQSYTSKPGARREIGYTHRGLAVIDLFMSMIGNRSYIMAIARRDLMAKYRGAFMGTLWLVGTPLALVLAYGFMTMGVFNMRIGGGGAFSTMVTLWFCVSLWQCFSETVGRCASIIADNAALAKRTAFPLTALPPAVIATSSMGLAISLSLGMITYLATVGIPPLAWVSLAGVLPAYFLLLLASAYFVAVCGAFSKDIRYVLPLALTIGMLVSPVLYPASRVPASLQWVAAVNPMTPIFESVRAVVSGQGGVDWHGVAVMSALGIVGAVASFWLFRIKSSEFTDVL